MRMPCFGIDATASVRRVVSLETLVPTLSHFSAVGASCKAGELARALEHFPTPDFAGVAGGGAVGCR